MAGENLVRPKGFKEWCENFWYHYKFYTIIAIVVIITLVVSIAQCSTKTQYDYRIILATNTAVMSSAQIEALEKQFVKYGEDINGDGVINVQLADCTINEYKTPRDQAMAKRQKMQAMLMNDTDAMILVSDGACFEWIKETLGGDFIENTGLPHKGGMAFELEGTALYENAKKEVEDNNEAAGITAKTVWPEGLNISRRTIEGTLFEGKDGVDKNAKEADELIQRIISQNSTKKGA